MFLAHYVTPGATVILLDTDKNSALRSLLQRLHTEIPHVVIEDLDSTFISVGLSHGGIQWDPDKQATVHLIILMLGCPGMRLKKRNISMQWLLLFQNPPGKLSCITAASGRLLCNSCDYLKLLALFIRRAWFLALVFRLFD